MHMTRQNNPWGFFNQLQRELNHPQTNSAPNESQSDWTPAVDIHENATAFTLMIDVPGVNPKSIDVSMEKGVLSIKGEREKETVGEDSSVKREERQHGLFSRHFNLPDSVDAENIEAKADNGVLTIVIPKQEVAVSRRIEVKH